MIPQIIIGLSIVGLVLYNLLTDDEEEEDLNPWEAESELSASLRNRYARF